MSINIPSTPFTIQTTVQLPPTPITTQTGTTYTFGLADAQTWVRFVNISGCIITIPPSLYPLGTQLTGEAATAGLVQFIAGSGVSFLPASPISALSQNAVVSFMQVDTNVWKAYGEIA